MNIKCLTITFGVVICLQIVFGEDDNDRVKRNSGRSDTLGGGQPGRDFPTLSKVPRNANFNCLGLRPGYYADEEYGCQVFHVCHSAFRMDSFLCPNGTIFQQSKLICDWWYNVDCSSSMLHHNANEEFGRTKKTKSRTSSGKDARKTGRGETKEKTEHRKQVVSQKQKTGRTEVAKDDSPNLESLSPISHISNVKPKAEKPDEILIQGVSLPRPIDHSPKVSAHRVVQNQNIGTRRPAISRGVSLPISNVQQPPRTQSIGIQKPEVGRGVSLPINNAQQSPRTQSIGIGTHQLGVGRGVSLPFSNIPQPPRTQSIGSHQQGAGRGVSLPVNNLQQPLRTQTIGVHQQEVGRGVSLPINNEQQPRRTHSIGTHQPGASRGVSLPINNVRQPPRTHSTGTHQPGASRGVSLPINNVQQPPRTHSIGTHQLGASRGVSLPINNVQQPPRTQSIGTQQPGISRGVSLPINNVQKVQTHRLGTQKPNISPGVSLPRTNIQHQRLHNIKTAQPVSSFRQSPRINQQQPPRTSSQLGVSLPKTSGKADDNQRIISGVPLQLPGKTSQRDQSLSTRDPKVSIGQKINQINQQDKGVRLPIHQTQSHNQLQNHKKIQQQKSPQRGQKQTQSGQTQKQKIENTKFRQRGQHITSQRGQQKFDLQRHLHAGIQGVKLPIQKVQKQSDRQRDNRLKQTVKTGSLGVSLPLGSQAHSPDHIPVSQKRPTVTHSPNQQKLSQGLSLPRLRGNNIKSSISDQGTKRKGQRVTQSVSNRQRISSQGVNLPIQKVNNVQNIHQGVQLPIRSKVSRPNLSKTKSGVSLPIQRQQVNRKPTDQPKDQNPFQLTSFKSRARSEIQKGIPLPNIKSTPAKTRKKTVTRVKTIKTPILGVPLPQTSFTLAHRPKTTPNVVPGVQLTSHHRNNEIANQQGVRLPHLDTARNNALSPPRSTPQIVKGVSLPNIHLNTQRSRSRQRGQINRTRSQAQRTPSIQPGVNLLSRTRQTSVEKPPSKVKTGGQSGKPPSTIIKKTGPVLQFTQNNAGLTSRNFDTLGRPIPPQNLPNINELFDIINAKLSKTTHIGGPPRLLGFKSTAIKSKPKKVVNKKKVSNNAAKVGFKTNANHRLQQNMKPDNKGSKRVKVNVRKLSGNKSSQRKESKSPKVKVNVRPVSKSNLQSNTKSTNVNRSRQKTQTSLSSINKQSGGNNVNSRGSFRSRGSTNLRGSTTFKSSRTGSNIFNRRGKPLSRVSTLTSNLPSKRGRSDRVPGRIRFKDDDLDDYLDDLDDLLDDDRFDRFDDDRFDDDRFDRFDDDRFDDDRFDRFDDDRFDDDRFDRFDDDRFDRFDDDRFDDDRFDRFDDDRFDRFDDDHIDDDRFDFDRFDDDSFDDDDFLRRRFRGKSLLNSQVRSTASKVPLKSSKSNLPPEIQLPPPPI